MLRIDFLIIKKFIMLWYIAHSTAFGQSPKFPEVPMIGSDGAFGHEYYSHALQRLLFDDGWDKMDLGGSVPQIIQKSLKQKELVIRSKVVVQYFRTKNDKQDQ